MTEKEVSTWQVDLPCPDCGNKMVFGYMLYTEQGEHQHTRYVCAFWPSGIRNDTPEYIYQSLWLDGMVCFWVE